uniref:Uncharacterized protein n=1 Tax=Setaria digitata TaxID=48799 RepID=A0A915Q0P9_9BILA
MVLRDSVNKNFNCDSRCSNEANGMDDANESEVDSDEDLEAGEKWLVFSFLFPRNGRLVNQLEGFQMFTMLIV